MMETYRFLLYITGLTARTEQAIVNLRSLCDLELTDNYELVVIDVLERPEVAEAEKILATPTLVKESPPPRRRITGDLSDPRRVLMVLGLAHGQTPAASGESP